MKKSLFSLLLSLVASSSLLAQSDHSVTSTSNGSASVIALPPQHLEATYNCSASNNPPDVTVTWSADRQNDEAPYQYKETVTIQNNLSTLLSGWTLGIPGASTKVIVDAPEGASSASFVILSYNFYDFETQQLMTAAFQSQMVETEHYNFSSGEPNHGEIITTVIFAGNAFRPSSLSNTANIQAAASLSFSYTTELPISSKLIKTAPAGISFSYSVPHSDLLKQQPSADAAPANS